MPLSLKLKGIFLSFFWEWGFLGAGILVFTAVNSMRSSAIHEQAANRRCFGLLPSTPTRLMR